MITVRVAGTLDTREMAEILSAIIKTGGTTALSDPVTRQDITKWMARAPGRTAWHVAERPNGRIMGFQWIEPHGKLPPTACSIATFVREGSTGLGIGSALFKATEDAARRLGYRWINATIRSYNSGGLVYYQSRGFEDYHKTSETISKRYDL